MGRLIPTALKLVTLLTFVAAVSIGGPQLVAATSVSCDTPPGSCMEPEDCDEFCPLGGLCTQDDCCVCFK